MPLDAYALIIGGDGQIGQHLALAMLAANIEFVATTRKWPPVDGSKLQFDLRYPTWLPKTNFTFLATGINGFKACEEDPEEAKRINTTLLVAAAQRAAFRGSKIIYLSSSAAETHPDTVYGTTKREAEAGILKLDSAVFRFGPVAFPGRDVYANETYSPINLSTLTAHLLRCFIQWEPGLHKLYNRNWKPEEAAA